MQKIFNWTIGSFFRSIGRIFAYLVIGGIISYLLYTNTNFRITDLLGIQKVSASSFEGRVVNNVTCKVDTTNWSCITDNYYSKILFQPQTKEIHRYTFDFSPQLVQSNSIVYIPIVIHRYGITSGQDDYTLDYDSSTEQFYISYSDTIDYYKFLVNVFIIDNQNNFLPCILHQSSLPNLTYACPVGNATSFSGVSIEANILAKDYYSEGNQWYFGFYRLMQVELDSTQAITNSINSVNQTISDTNSTTESSQASDFFHDYNETSQDGIIAIVNMPLNIFNALTLGSTQDLCFNLKGKQVCLPSGDIIWGKTSRTSIKSGNATFTPHPFSAGGSLSEPLSLFKGLFNLVVGGYLCYKMLKSLMRITNDMLNPTKDKLEVLEL